jgi:hypothetical protein
MANLDNVRDATPEEAAILDRMVLHIDTPEDLAKLRALINPDWRAKPGRQARAGAVVSDVK